MYKALDIANYIICYTVELNKPVNYLKLSNILYYSYTTYLQETGKKLFPEPFYISFYANIVDEVYSRFKGYESYPITKTSVEVEFIDNKFIIYTFDDMKKQIDNNTEVSTIIKRVVDRLIDYPINDLVTMLREEESFINVKHLISGNERIKLTIDDLYAATVVAPLSLPLVSMPIPDIFFKLHSQFAKVQKWKLF